jgi:hypothetical protein
LPGGGIYSFFNGIWGSSSTDLYAIGGLASRGPENFYDITHYDGYTWVRVKSGCVDYLFLGGIWGSSGADIFTVGDNGTILHYNGSAWHNMSNPAFGDLNGLWGTSATNVFAVGEGTMLHYDGITWDFIDNAPFYSFYSFWGSPDKDYFVVGASGIILYYVGDADNDEMSNDIDNCINVYNPLQEDSYPPQGNEIGDACDCEGNFNCAVDQNVDGLDAATFKVDFGRSEISEPCTSEAPCNGDFSCDGNVDGLDTARFKSDFGRSGINNPCPVCTSGGAWCVYP